MSAVTADSVGDTHLWRNLRGTSGARVLCSSTYLWLQSIYSTLCVFNITTTVSIFTQSISFLAQNSSPRTKFIPLRPYAFPLLIDMYRIWSIGALVLSTTEEIAGPVLYTLLHQPGNSNLTVIASGDASLPLAHTRTLDQSRRVPGMYNTHTYLACERVCLVGYATLRSPGNLPEYSLLNGHIMSQLSPPQYHINCVRGIKNLGSRHCCRTWIRSRVASSAKQLVPSMLLCQVYACSCLKFLPGFPATRGQNEATPANYLTATQYTHAIH